MYCTICGNDAHERRRYAAVGLGIETVYADETQTTTKTFTAEQLEVIWGNAKSKLEDSKWKLSFENQYDQVKWKVPEAIALSDVKSVTFHVADQKDPLL